MKSFSLKVKVPKGLGKATGNLYRHALGSQTEAWTPAAFHIGNDNSTKTTILRTEANTSSDMIQVMTTLIGCTYSISDSNVGNKDIISASIRVSGSTKLKDLEKTSDFPEGTIKVHGRNREVILFNLNDSNDVIFTVIFVKQCGDIEKAAYREMIDNCPDISLKSENLCIFSGEPDIYSSLGFTVDTDGIHDIVTVNAGINMDLSQDFFENMNKKIIESLQSTSITFVDTEDTI